MTFNEQVVNKSQSILDDLAHLLVGLPKPLQLIAKELCTKSATLELNAGYSGAMSDYGAREVITKFRTFIAGYNYYDTYNHDADEKENPYEELLGTIEQQNSPEYQQYLILKQKFEK